jgi:hypothetical protein
MNLEPRFRLTVRPERSSVPVEVRLRRAIKTLLRAFHLRVVELEPLPAERETTAEQGPPTT